MTFRHNGLSGLQTRSKDSLRKLDWVIVLIFCLSLFLRWLIPAQIVPNSPNDDYLGVMLANNLLHGHWLGGWTSNTLSKPPAYSFFLMLAHFIPVDPTVILHAIYLLIVLAFLRNLRKYFEKELKSWPALNRVFFLLFAFNPAVLANDFSRIYRISLDSLASLLFFVLILRLANVLKNIYLTADKTVWKSIKLSQYSKISSLIGFTYAVMILTRSEGYWVLITSIPFVFAIWLSSIISNNRSWKSISKYSSGIVLIKMISVAVIAFLVPIGIVSEVNKSVYGVSEIENFYTGNYARAINIWEGVENGKSTFSFIPVSKGQRDAVYKVSPAALSLKATLDGPPNTGWKTFNCSTTKICDESGAWFPWELRTAAIDNNHISNEIQFQQFFGVLANELENACKTHQIKCGAAGAAPGARSFLDYPPHQLLDTSMKAFGSLFTLDQAANVGHPDNGQDPTELKIWHETVNFNYLIVNDDFSNWKGMAHTITTLRTIYQGLLPILFLLATYSLFIRRKKGAEILNWYALCVLGAMFVFSGGLAIVESSLGFGAGFLSLYALPMQPLLLLFIAVGVSTLFYQYEGTQPDSE